jgi:hypothetical protein
MKKLFVDRRFIPEQSCINGLKAQKIQFHNYSSDQSCRLSKKYNLNLVFGDTLD